MQFFELHCTCRLLQFVNDCNKEDYYYYYYYYYYYFIIIIIIIIIISISSRLMFYRLIARGRHVEFTNHEHVIKF